MTKDEGEQEQNLKFMEEEIQEVFVSRQDVSFTFLYISINF